MKEKRNCAREKVNVFSIFEKISFQKREKIWVTRGKSEHKFKLQQFPIKLPILKMEQTTATKYVKKYFVCLVSLSQRRLVFRWLPSVVRLLKLKWIVMLSPISFSPRVSPLSPLKLIVFIGYSSWKYTPILWPEFLVFDFVFFVILLFYVLHIFWFCAEAFSLLLAAQGLIEQATAASFLSFASQRKENYFFF